MDRFPTSGIPQYGIVVKGIGGSRSKMRSRMILKIQIMYFQELFTESKKLAVLSFSVVAKLARTPKSYTFLDFRFFQSQNWANPFYLAPDNF